MWSERVFEVVSRPFVSDTPWVTDGNAMTHKAWEDAVHVQWRSKVFDTNIPTLPVEKIISSSWVFYSVKLNVKWNFLCTFGFWNTTRKLRLLDAHCSHCCRFRCPRVFAVSADFKSAREGCFSIDRNIDLRVHFMDSAYLHLAVKITNTLTVTLYLLIIIAVKLGYPNQERILEN